jgi:hypothetical protein
VSASPKFIDQQLVVGGKRRLGWYEIRLGGGGIIVGQLFGAAGDDSGALGRPGNDSHGVLFLTGVLIERCPQIGRPIPHRGFGGTEVSREANRMIHGLNVIEFSYE